MYTDVSVLCTAQHGAITDTTFTMTNYIFSEMSPKDSPHFSYFSRNYI